MHGVKLQSSVFEIVEKIETFQEQSDLERYLSEELKNLGIDNFGLSEFGGVPVDQRVYLDQSANDEWKQAYFQERLERYDPVVLELYEGSSGPIYWDHLVQRYEPQSKPWDVMNRARLMGFEQGVSFPIKGSGGQLACVSMLGPLAKEGGLACRALDYVAIYLYRQVVSLSGRPDWSGQKDLTERERECVLWMTHGKSDWETGEILNISQHTVRTHIRRSMVKLGVFSRVHLAAEALRQGQIRY